MKIFELLEKELKKIKRLVDLRGDLLKLNVIKEIEELNGDILNIILNNNILKNKFTKNFNGVLIIDKEHLKMFFNNKEFLPDSYTKFKNKIGLTSEGTYIDYNSDILLDFPYKDSVLVGGQSKEDVNRKEKFYNSIIAFEEIDILFDNKSFINIEKHSSIGMEKITKFDKNENLLIKGNNLLAMHSLKSIYSGKIKCIYIDVPYNTGNDSFKYNDSFNHSTWLTFMKNRLEIAKELLSDNGFIIAQCDDNEQAYLKVLMDEVFGRKSFLNTISVEMSSSGGVKAAHKTKKIPTVSDYLLFYKKKEAAINPLYDEIEEYDTHYSIYYDGFRFSSVTKEFGKIDWKNKNFQENIYKNINNIFQSRSIEDELPLNSTYVGTIDSYDVYNYKGEIYRSKNGHVVRLEPLSLKLKEDKLVILRGNIWKNFHKEMGNISKEGGVELKSGKKPESLIRNIISMTTEEGDIVLDFFAGSGTTLAVAHKMNRQYIGIEQMDYIEDLTKKRLLNVIKGDLTGISKFENWKGGGSFIYMEMKEVSMNLIKKITQIQSEKDVDFILNLISKYEIFLDTDFSIEIFKSLEFANLSIEDKKLILIDSIDKNTLYLNYSDILDSFFDIDQLDIEFNKSFYGDK